jgi:macrolide phosphotransferase
VDRSLRLAALASAAVPGLDPIAVQEVVGGDEDFEVAFIQDTQQRRWVVRAPRNEVAAAHMDASLAMLALLVRRVPFAVPAAKGFAPVAGIGRAAVYSYIPGHPLDLSALQPRHPATADLGRTIAMIHNVDRGLFEEAGLPSYAAEEYRIRHLAEIDRGAATGRVPAGLLSRWEEALDDVRLWRFAPTPVHGALSGSDVLVTFPNPTDAERATVRGVTGWEAAKVADPADDFAGLLAASHPGVVDAVLAAYVNVRVERPDEHLLARARLVSELALLGALLRAVAARDEVATEATTARLRRLDDTVHSEGASRRLRIVPSGPSGAPSEVEGRSRTHAGPPGARSPGTKNGGSGPKGSTHSQERTPGSTVAVAGAGREDPAPGGTTAGGTTSGGATSGGATSGGATSGGTTSGGTTSGGTTSGGTTSGGTTAGGTASGTAAGSPAVGPTRAGPAAAGPHDDDATDVIDVVAGAPDTPAAGRVDSDDESAGPREEAGDGPGDDAGDGPAPPVHAEAGRRDDDPDAPGGPVHSRDAGESGDSDGSSPDSSGAAGGQSRPR